MYRMVETAEDGVSALLPCGGARVGKLLTTNRQRIVTYWRADDAVERYGRRNTVTAAGCACREYRGWPDDRALSWRSRRGVWHNRIIMRIDAPTEHGVNVDPRQAGLHDK